MPSAKCSAMTGRRRRCSSPTLVLQSCLLSRVQLHSIDINTERSMDIPTELHEKNTSPAADLSTIIMDASGHRHAWTRSNNEEPVSLVRPRPFVAQDCGFDANKLRLHRSSLSDYPGKLVGNLIGMCPHRDSGHIDDTGTSFVHIADFDQIPIGRRSVYTARPPPKDIRAFFGQIIEGPRHRNTMNIRSGGNTTALIKLGTLLKMRPGSPAASNRNPLQPLTQEILPPTQVNAASP
ncbi:hypothetical protein C8R47DRAFT_1138700 [Mycena vitilis]|nr:hypothetical protein C8R47DRAFT_1138700 [Mycena vitilis]